MLRHNSADVLDISYMYLFDKSGETVSLALVAQGPAAAGVTAGGGIGFNRWANGSVTLLREGCDKAGKYCYTPLYALKRPLEPFNWKRPFRDGDRELEGDELWRNVYPPWEPLDEDGEEDPVDVDGWNGDDY